MTNFKGATLVKADECDKALKAFCTKRKEFLREFEYIKEQLKKETVVSRFLFIFPFKETKWSAVERYNDGLWSYNARSMHKLGFITKHEWERYYYFHFNGSIQHNQIKKLTNNGTRDAYLNPEQAEFVNRWGYDS